jgi:hypothetical protein
MRNVGIIGLLLVAALYIFLLFTMAVPPGQSPLPIMLPVLLIILAQMVFWVLITEGPLVIAGDVWGALWLARKVGLPLPAALTRETPLDTLRVKARYARGDHESTVRGNETRPQ